MIFTLKCRLACALIRWQYLISKCGVKFHWNVIWVSGKRMSMGTLKYWSIGKYIIHCHLLYLRKLIFNNKQFISQNTIVCFRAMAAYEEKVPVVEEAEQHQRSTMEEYKQLIICGNIMPDPFLLQNGSLTEKKKQI